MVSTLLVLYTKIWSCVYAQFHLLNPTFVHLPMQLKIYLFHFKLLTWKLDILLQNSSHLPFHLKTQRD